MIDFCFRAPFCIGVAVFCVTAHAFIPAGRESLRKHVGAMAMEKTTVPWAGGGVLSDITTAVINTPLLWRPLKFAARKVLKDTAEKRGIKWSERSAALYAVASEVNILEAVSNTSIQYPSYYTQPFHAYDEGNLCWAAAVECESASYSMGLRVWPKEQLSPQEAQLRLRTSFTSLLQRYMNKHGVAADTLVDVGCSVGISTQAIQQAIQPKQTYGVDASPYMLAIAKLRERESQTSQENQIQWIHALGEKLPFPSEHANIYTMCFVLHELPNKETCEIFREAFRVLKPGSVFALTDNDPRSPVLQKLPVVLFTLMKSTEPWSDEYYALDVEAALRDAGFVDIEYHRSDPRHRTILARKPSV